MQVCASPCPEDYLGQQPSWPFSRLEGLLKVYVSRGHDIKHEKSLKKKKKKRHSYAELTVLEKLSFIFGYLDY